MTPLLSGDCEGSDRIRRNNFAQKYAKNWVEFSLDRYAYARCTKIPRRSRLRRRLDGCRLDLPPRRQCLPLTWGSVNCSLSVVHWSPTITDLWARDATSFRLGIIGVVLAVLLILASGYDLFFVALPKKSWVVALWFVCAMAGAVFAAFAFGWQRASAARRGLPSFVAAVLIGIGIVAAIALAGHHSIGFPLPKLVFLLKQFLLYFTVSFALEEVAFRGALDSHVYQPQSDGHSSGSPWLSAIFVSALWGFGICLRFPLPTHLHLQRRSHF